MGGSLGTRPESILPAQAYSLKWSKFIVRPESVWCPMAWSYDKKDREIDAELKEEKHFDPGTSMAFFFSNMSLQNSIASTASRVLCFSNFSQAVVPAVGLIEEQLLRCLFNHKSCSFTKSSIIAKLVFASSRFRFRRACRMFCERAEDAI